MSVISAVQVKELRERTGAGMMECKKALEVSGGDMEGAIEELRKRGIAKAGNKASRVAAEGAVAIFEDGKKAAMIEVNSETDFVARHEDFTSFIKILADVVAQSQVEDVAQLSNLKFPETDQTIEQARQALVAKVGENVQIRRLVHSQSQAECVGCYTHGSRIGVIVELNVDNKELARDIAMHIAASKPLVISPEDVPQDLVAKEKEIYLAQAANSGKPKEIIEKMTLGRLKKFLDEVSLVGQPFVKDPDVTVGSLLNRNNAKVLAFYRFEVGEGIDKIVEDFKDAVMSQVQGG